MGRNLKAEKQNLVKSLNKADISLRKKREELEATLHKLFAIKRLVSRNKRNDLANNVKFPFLLIVPDSSRDTIVE